MITEIKNLKWTMYFLFSILLALILLNVHFEVIQSTDENYIIRITDHYILDQENIEIKECSSSIEKGLFDTQLGLRCMMFCATQENVDALFGNGYCTVKYTYKHLVLRWL